MASTRLAILISGGGTTLQNFIDAIRVGELHASIELVISSRHEAFGLQRAAAADLRTAVVRKRDYPDTATFSAAIFHLCDAARVDLVLLAGWLTLVEIPPRYAGRVMNIHPSLLPKFGGKGMFGHHVHEAVLAAGETQSGCTVHWVTNEYDAGPVILQRTCPVLAQDTPEQLAARVFEQEKIAYLQAVRQWQGGRS
jgi:formyltetrahydrofolate-dependent phosphoribosylglycinamide formyltransferase